MDSTCSKDSNGILFVIFWVVYWKIWFLQVCRYLKGFESNLNQNRSGLDTWQLVIRRYRFVRIIIVERWIKRDLDGSDRPVPLRLSGSIGSTGSRSDGRDQKGEGYLLGLGLRRDFSGEISPARFLRWGGSGSHSGESTAISGWRRCYDKTRSTAGILFVWSTTWIASSTRVEGRLELDGATVMLWSSTSTSIRCVFDEGNESGRCARRWGVEEYH
jgi:hypothetical protein